MISDDMIIKAAREYRTPLYIFDEGEVKKRVREIKGILGEKTGLCYSIKANPFLIESAGSEAGLLEVCSPGELKICMSLKVGGEHIIYSGVNKTLENCLEAVEYNCREYTAESLKHLDLLQEAAERCNRQIEVLIRFSSGSQFGMSKEDVMTAFDRAAEGRYPKLEITGIHYFVGTQREKNKHRAADLEKVSSLFEEIRKDKGIELKRLEYGPGLPYPYFEGEDFEDTLKPLREFKEELDGFPLNVDLVVEMGRFIASSCGYYLTSIDDIKRTGQTDYCIVDGGINHVNYLGGMMGMKNPIIRHLRLGEAADCGKKIYTLCGSLCTTNDILIRQLELDNAAEGDILVFCNIGAYSVTEGLYLFLSRDLPAVVLYDPASYENGFKSVREHDPTYVINMERG